MATREDAGKELEYAAEMINRIVQGVRGPRIGVHVCRGNWSTKEDVHLTGDYAPLVPTFAKMRVNQFVLEFATPRAGEVDIVGEALNDREIGLGVVNPRTTEPESVDEIVERAERATPFYTPEQIFLNPDCGFGCFANRCVNEEAIAVEKLRRLVQAAERLREKYA